MAGDQVGPVVAGQPLVMAASDDAQALVALPDTEEPAAADAIGRGDQGSIRGQKEQGTAQMAEAQQGESVWEPAPAAVKPAEQPTQAETLEDIAAERERLRQENKKLQAEKDRVYAQAQAEALRREQLRAEYEERQAAIEAERRKYEAELQRYEAERAEARRRAEEAEYQRMLAASPPEVRKAMEVATQFIQQQKQREVAENAQRAVTKMNQYMMQGVPGEVFSGLPKDRPITPEMVDYAAARYYDWQYMQETFARPDVRQWWEQARAKKRGEKQAGVQPAPQPPVAQPVQPAQMMPAASAPRPEPVAKVTPGTGGKPPSNLDAQFNAARAQRDIKEMERVRNLLAARSGVESKSE